MSHLHLSTTALSIVLTIGAVVFYGAFVLYGAYIDGRRQKMRDKGLHPVTDSTGEVHAREEEQENGSKRS